MPGNNVFLPQVTRIPITGSDQYNTLVCVTASDFVRYATIDNIGKLERGSQTISTLFKLFGLLDQNPPVAPVFDHSTMATLTTIGPANHGSWIVAVDSVTGAGFDPSDGSYFVNVDTACMPCMVPIDQCIPLLGICLWYTIIEVTSFVLCYEPPAKSEGHRRPRPRHFEKSAVNARRIEPPRVGLSAEALWAQLGGTSLPGSFTAPPVPGPTPGGGTTEKGCGC
jgi:hypothetical protein